MKKIAVFSILLILIIGALFAIMKNGESEEGEIKLIAVKRGNVSEKALAIGTIEPENEIKVKSAISGIVNKVFFKVGDKVSKGDPLFRISPNPTPVEFAQAKRNMQVEEVALKQCRDERERNFKLFRERLISKADMDAYNSKYEKQLLKFKISSEKLKLLDKGKINVSGRNINSTIYAPVTGVVLSQEVFPGDPVVPLTNFQPGTEMCAMADMSKLLFKGTVDEIDVGKLKEGMGADIKPGALPESLISGKLIRIAPKATKDGNATLFSIEVEIVPVKDIVLRAGYSATCSVKIKEALNALTIPERLVTFRDKKKFVEVKRGQNISEKEIKTGLSDGLIIEVTEGLKKGDMVVQRPPREIK